MDTQSRFSPSILSISNQIATLTLKSSTGVNQINSQWIQSLKLGIEEAFTDPDVRGLILTSDYDTFCVGADLNIFDPSFLQENQSQLQSVLNDLNAVLRSLETQGRPVVAALNGSALGGGYEVALACHYRVAINRPTCRIGLPEVMLGLLPGGGGTQRLPRLIGIQPALECILQGRAFTPEKALKKGLIDAVVETRQELLQVAQAYIFMTTKAQQPWDRKGATFPGGVQPKTKAALQLFMGASAQLYKKTAGAYLGAQRALEVVQEGCGLKFDASLKIEQRAFMEVSMDPLAVSRIRTLWFHKRALEKGESRLHLPHTPDHFSIDKISIIGAGMMGAELACLCAKIGKTVILKDVNSEALDKAMETCSVLIEKQSYGNEEKAHQWTARIRPSLELEDIRGSDLVIEAVFEDLKLKHRIIQEIEPLLEENAIFASNTSALPISDLAQVSIRPQNMIGLHFFSPVSKMPLVEIIETSQTNITTLQKSWALCRAIKKTPIIVGDGYGFYTTGVFASYSLEGAQCVAEGYSPALVEWAARSAGMAVAPLKVFDEVTLTLGMHAMEMRALYDLPITHKAGVQLLKLLVEQGRLGKAKGAGFYQYDSKPNTLWEGLLALSDHTQWKSTSSDFEDLQTRLLLTQALEAIRCLEDGVLKTPQDGDVGALLGLGFAPSTGGPFSWMDYKGLSWILEQAIRLTQQGYHQFSPPALLQEMVDQNRSFFE